MNNIDLFLVQYGLAVVFIVLLVSLYMLPINCRQRLADRLSTKCSQTM